MDAKQQELLASIAAELKAINSAVLKISLLLSVLESGTGDQSQQEAKKW